ncbi:MAG: ribose 5-phosphate isomerase B [Eubacterium sp.]|nr:ribose 5-phosphate isomerase B [Eubacterium sp.]
MLVIGCDRAGYQLKLDMMQVLDDMGEKYIDIGCNGETCDYPDIAETACEKIIGGECDKGILICGTGIGISMAANKVKGIRAAVCHNEYTSEFTRLHNDANVLCMGGRVIGSGVAEGIVRKFLTTEFEGGRHAARVEKIMDIENK